MPENVHIFLWIMTTISIMLTIGWISKFIDDLEAFPGVLTALVFAIFAFLVLYGSYHI